MYEKHRNNQVTPKLPKPVMLNSSLFIEVDLTAGWSNIFSFSFLSHFDLEYGGRMKCTIILPKCQTYKLWKSKYSHQTAYNLFFYILTWENDIHDVCAVVNKVGPFSLFGLKMAGLPLCLFFCVCMKNYYYSSACWNWIILFLHNFSLNCCNL